MRPIDLLDNLSKAPLAGREQGIQQANAEFGQRHGAQALERQHRLDQTRTKAGENAEGPDNRVDDHPDDGRGNQRRSRRQQNQDDNALREAVELHAPSPASRQIDLLA
jgi:hypothetical protein